MLTNQTAVRMLFRFDALVTTVSGLLLLLMPDSLADWLQLGSIPIVAMRVVGAIWVAFGLWMFTLWGRAYTKEIATFAAGILAPNALLLIFAATLGRFGIGTLGWVVLLGTATFIGFVTAQWVGLRGRLDD